MKKAVLREYLKARAVKPEELLKQIMEARNTPLRPRTEEEIKELDSFEAGTVEVKELKKATKKAKKVKEGK